jgi:hypothetical protein
MAENYHLQVKTLFFLMFGLLLLSGCDSGRHQFDNEIDSYSQLKQLFKDPPPEYRSAPLWDWNDKITEEGIDFHMKKFKEGGLGGVFIHPRPGLLTEYLSEDWHRLFDYTVKKGKELGLKVWIYDENSYPSGFAGGHVPAQMPDSYRHGTGLSCEFQETLDPDTGRYEVILKKENEGFRDVTSERNTEKGKQGIYYLFKRTYGQKSYWYGNYPYVDLLYKGVTQKFMDITMKGYEKYNEADFGTAVMGIFTDEPNLEAAMGPNSVIRWTPDLYSEFKKRWGYDLKVNLPSLVDEIGNWKRIRHNYYELILEMFLNRWAKPWFEYCEKKGLARTGHYWEHGWPVPTEGIDEAAFYIYHQQPGVDMLGNGLVPGGKGGQFGNTRAIRELHSAANQGGHLRMLSETYGGAGWEINFATFKRLVDWEVVLGVNFVNQHLSYYTLKGVRKFDYPPSFTYHEPWWEEYKPMGDYIGRISLAMSSGQQINKILVLQPNTTAWMYFSRKVKNAMLDSIKDDFKTFVYRLERNYFEYDLGSENVIKTIGSVKNGKFIVGEREYELVVIPKSMANMDHSTSDLLKLYLDQGGKVLSFANHIPFSDGVESPTIEALIDSYPNQWTFANNTDDLIVAEMFAQKDFKIADDGSNEGEIYFQRRIMDNGQLVLFVNSDSINPASATIQAKGKSLIRLDLTSGDCYQQPVKPEKGSISFQINLPPVGSALYYFSENKLSEPSENSLLNKETPIDAIGDITVHAADKNVLVLDYLDVKSDKIDFKETYFMQPMLKLFESNGFQMGNPWQHKIQYKQDYLALDTFKTGSGFEANYHFVVSKNADLKKLKEIFVVVERPELWDVYLNGRRLVKSDKWWIDREFYQFPVGDNLVKGKNILTLKAPKMSVHAELMPAYIVGDFILNPLNKGFEIIDGNISHLGSWKAEGYPFYSQKMAYIQKFNLKNDDSQYKIKLNKWNGTLAEVLVNGKSAGLIMWPPYELNISSLLSNGENEIIVNVIGSLKNTFGYFYKDNNRSINGPYDWNEAPLKQPSIDQYYLMDYGLFEPFSLIGMK